MAFYTKKRVLIFTSCLSVQYGLADNLSALDATHKVPPQILLAKLA